MSDPKRVRREPQPGSVNPGDQAPRDTPGTGEIDCPECGGTGRSQGITCGNCGGTGRVNVGVGGA